MGLTIEERECPVCGTYRGNVVTGVYESGRMKVGLYCHKCDQDEWLGLRCQLCDKEFWSDKDFDNHVNRCIGEEEEFQMKTAGLLHDSQNREKGSGEVKEE